MNNIKTLVDNGSQLFNTVNNNTELRVWKVSGNFNPIPLEKLCSLEVRELLEQGTPKGSGHNQSAIKVAKEVIGVENYCQAAGIAYEGTARELYESFLLASGIDSDSTTESRWKCAIAANPSPSLSPDKIQNCLNAWNRQHGQTGGQRINLTRPQAPKKSKQSATLPPIEGPVKLARFDVIPTDRPHRQTNPSWIPKDAIKAGASNSQVTFIEYSYSPNQRVTRYEWPDATEPKGYDKTFTQSYRDKSGEWQPNKGNDPWPAYRKDEVIAAKGWPLIVEGEEATDTARCELGLKTITFQGSNWSEGAIAQVLVPLKQAGCPGIVILPDNDETGEGKGQKVLSVAAKIGLPALIVPMTYLHPECPEKGDIADWVKWGQSMGMTQDDFIKRLEAEIHAAVNRRSQLSQESETVADKPGDKVEQARIEIKKWLLENDPVAKALTRADLCRVYGIDRKTFDAIAVSLDESSDKPKAKRLKLSEFLALPTAGSPLLAPGIASMGVTIVAGSPGAGKTTFAYDLAGAVLMGDEFLGEVPARRGAVLFVTSDEQHQWGQDKLINRGIAGHVSDDEAQIMGDWDVSQWGDLETSIEDMRPALVIVDSFNAIHNDPNFDENSAQASQTIKKLERLSSKYCVPIVLIHHLGKSKDNKGVNKLRGSTAIAASASSILLLEGEGTAKRLSQPKIRGSEPLNLTLEMDCENGRFRVTGGNVTDDATKSVLQRLKDFYTASPGLYEAIELQGYFPDIPRKQLTNGLNRLLGTVIHGKPVIKRPSKLNPHFKVYGVDCTSGEDLSQLPPLSPSTFPANFDDVTSESPTLSKSREITTMSQVMSQPCHNQNNCDVIVTSESPTLTANHQITTQSQPGDERGGHVESLANAVPMETAPIPVNNSTAINDQETTGAIAVETRFKTGDWVVCRGDETVKMQIVSIVDNGMATVSFPDDPEVTGLIMALSDLSPCPAHQAITAETFQESETVATGEQSEPVETAQSSSQWEEFTGQELSVGNWVWHDKFGSLSVTMATRTGTLKAKSQDGANYDLTDCKQQITHLWKALPVVEPT